MSHIRPIKILFLHLGNAFGGAERTTYNLLKNINTEIFKITLITSKQLFPKFSSIPCDSIIYTEDIGIDIYFDYSTPLSKDVKILADILKANNYDIAFGMMHYASSLLACVKNIYKTKSKIVSSPRGPLNIFLNKCINKKEERFFYETIFSFFCRTSDCLIVPSQGVKDDCILHFGAKNEKVIIIPDSVDLYDIQQKLKVRLEITLPHNFSIISIACRLSFEKNLPFLIKAFSEIRKDFKVKLLIIGDGPEKTNLQALCKSLTIEDDVCFVGFQENPFKYIAASDVFVHTCLFEGFGNAIIEAMACKVPVIATDCPYGPGEIIKQGENGVLVRMNDLEGLINSIKTILANKKIKKYLATQGFITASCYSIDKMVSAYETFFYNLACDLLSN